MGQDIPPVQTGPGAHPASCTIGTESFLGVKSGRGVTLNPHPLLVPWSWKVELYLYSPYGPYGLYRASVPVQGWPLPYLTLTNIFLLFVVVLITGHCTCLTSTSITFQSSDPTWFRFCVIQQVIAEYTCCVIIFWEHFRALVCCHCTLSSEYFSLLSFLFFCFVALFWNIQCPFSSFKTYEGTFSPLIMWNGLYSCLFTMSVGCATLFLPLGLGDNPNFFWWNRKC